MITRAKKSIANFKIRKGMPIGCCVTLRGAKMYEFLDRLCNVVLPRVRDFKGLSPNSFDGRGNYTLGLKDQFVFPGNRLHPRGQDQGHEHHHHHQARNDEEGRELLKMLGVPLRARRNKWRRTAQFAKMRKKPKFKVRVRNRCRCCGRAARLHPQVQHVPHLFPPPGAPGRNPRRHQGELVVVFQMELLEKKDERC